MASFDNFSNEKSSVFEDADYDPDLEARLYAEIYYSNETYEQDSTVTTENTADPTTSLPCEFDSAAAESSQSSANKENFVEDPNPNVADGAIEKFADPRTFYPSRSWICKEQRNKDIVSASGQQSARQGVVRKQRLLAREGLWLPRVRPATETRSVQPVAETQSVQPVAETQFVQPPPDDREDISLDRRLAELTNNLPATTRSHDAADVFTQFHDGLTTFSEINRVSVSARRRALNFPGLSSTAAKKIEKKERRRRSKVLKRQQLRAARKLQRRPNRYDDEDLAEDTSKYRVVSKSIKLNMRRMEMEPVNISSDSDDSILEVPVPPKAPPPVIHLQDSDDECGQPSPRRSKKSQKPSIDIREECSVSSIPETNSSLDEEPIVEPTPQTGPPNFEKPSKEAAKKSKTPEISVATPTNLQSNNEDDSGKSSKSRSRKSKKRTEENCDEPGTGCDIVAQRFNDDESSVATIIDVDPTNSPNNSLENARKSRMSRITATIDNPVENDLVLNCTEIQKSVSCLEDIRKMRDSGSLSRAHSDDSMTESETNNWVNIAAGQANSSRKDSEISFIDPSLDHANTAVWDQLNRENTAALIDIAEEIAGTSGISNLPIESPGRGPKDNFEITIVNSDEANSRKRQKDSGSGAFDDFDVPAVPEKRVKHGKQRMIREQSMTDYFFKPMSKELQTFYNYPWGGENQDLFDIQSRMPRNPRCWAILDADLRGPSPRKRNTCPRCKSDSHFGKRCTEKVKPPCCYMCGAKGHTESRCPHTMCLTCGRKYATYRPTCGFCSQLFCHMCKGIGHSRENCPDLWRRYHSTTTETMPTTPRDTANIMKPTQNLSCCNCGKRGHDSTMCRQLRWSQHFLTPTNVTNYTDGPTYEPPPRNILQQPLTREIHSSNVQSLVPQISRADLIRSRPRIETFRQEDIKVTNFPENTETIVIDEALPSSESSSIIPEDRVIFQAGQFDHEKTIGWQKFTQRLDKMENLHLNGLLNGRSIPKFLGKWQYRMEFGVKIIQKLANKIYATIQCRNFEDLKQLKKIMFQWLSRTDEEKRYCKYKEIPCHNVTILRREMECKFALLQSDVSTVKLLKKIKSYDISLKQMSRGLMRCKKSKQHRMRRSKLRNIIKLTKDTRSRMIVSLYKANLVEKGKVMISRFEQLLKKIQSSLVEVSTQDYYEIVYLYNELFVFHKTKELERALEEAVEMWKRDPVPAVVLESFEYPDADLGMNDYEDEENEVRDFNDQRLVDNNSFDDSSYDQQVDVIQDTLAHSIEVLRDLGASCTSPAIPQSSVDLTIDHHYDSVDNETIRGKNPRLRRTGAKKTGKWQTSENPFFKKGPRQRKKDYEYDANVAIEKARTSHVPRLRKMAENLANQMRNLNANPRDIAKLNAALARAPQHQNSRLSKTQRRRMSRRKINQSELSITHDPARVNPPITE